MRHLLPRWPRREHRTPPTVRGEYVPTVCMALPGDPPDNGTVFPCNRPMDHTGRHVSDARLGNGVIVKDGWTWPNDGPTPE